MKITIHPDKIKITGALIDGTWRITLDVGEYERHLVSELVKLNPEAQLEVTIEAAKS